jgi:hypothetical protein
LVALKSDIGSKIAPKKQVKTKISTCDVAEHLRTPEEMAARNLRHYKRRRLQAKQA